LAIQLDHAGVTGLNGAELLVITNTGDRRAHPVDQINETLFNVSIVNHIIDDNSRHVFPPKQVASRYAAKSS
jgi:hypothetical protein